VASFFSCSVRGGGEGEDAQPDKQTASVNASVQAAIIRTASPPFVRATVGHFKRVLKSPPASSARFGRGALEWMMLAERRSRPCHSQLALSGQNRPDQSFDPERAFSTRVC
jgi:hypothetical protein